MREELTSGRLAAFLGSIRRADLLPSPRPPRPPDEQLDAWLGALPTTRPSRPELEVHPVRLAIRARGGGGILRQTVQVTNVGYRLLRSTARVEPAATAWLRLAPEFTGDPFVTIEHTDMTVEVVMPESLDAPLTAALVIESNGGTKRVEVRLERPPAADSVPEAGTESASASRVNLDLREAIARQSLGFRLVAWVAAAAVLRLLIVASSALFGGPAQGEPAPALHGPAIVMAILGCGLGVVYALRRGAARDLFSTGFAGGFLGVLASAVMVAACRAIEPNPPSSLLAVVLWSALAAALAFLSQWLVPPRTETEKTP